MSAVATIDVFRAYGTRFCATTQNHRLEPGYRNAADIADVIITRTGKYPHILRDLVWSPHSIDNVSYMFFTVFR
jgi:hypothetical protein